MISLARANLLHDKRHHATAVIVLMLTGALMVCQLGFVFGYSKSANELQQQLPADLIVSQRHSDGTPNLRAKLSPQLLTLIAQHAAVERVEPWSNSNGYAKWQPFDPQLLNERRGTQATEFVVMRVLDPSEYSLNFPKKLSTNIRRILTVPFTVVLPQSTARELGVSVGELALLNGHRVRVGAVVPGFSGGYKSTVFLSPQTQQLVSSNRDPSLFLVKLAVSAQPLVTQHQLNQHLQPHGLIATQPAQTDGFTGWANLFRGYGRVLISSAIFSLLIGCGIASQTLRNAMLGQQREFAALRALGVSRWQLSLVALEHAWWTGLVSIPLTIVLAFIVQWLAGWFDVVIHITAFLLWLCTGLLLGVAMLAGVFALTAVFRTQPAEMLR